MELEKTLVHQLAHWAKETPDEPAIHEKDDDGNWRTYTWGQYWEAVRNTAKGLIALGHEPGDCVALIGGSRCGWVICEFAIMAARGIPAPIYPNNTVDQASYIVNHSKAKIAIADTAEQLDKFREGNTKEMISTDLLVQMDDLYDDKDGEISLEALQEKGKNEDDDELDARLEAIDPDDTLLLIYTSGTTGTPKAVQLSSTNMLSLIDAMLSCFPMFYEGQPFRIVSYLPLCHVAEQIATNFTQLATGGQAFFCGDLTQIKDYLTDVRPTIFLGVPRVWEKFQAALEARFAEATGLKAWLANWARNTELACFKEEVRTGQPCNTFWRSIAQSLVISKVKDALGLNNLALAVTGAAPISLGTLEFFASLGITIYEVYGQSETTGIVTAGRQGKPRFGTVGKAFHNVELKIAEDGEILAKGPVCTAGYLHQEAATAELFDDDGWLCTGDLGQLDDEGYLSITGRKKDILVTAGGKNVAPAEMEAHINQITGVGQVVVVGDRQPYLTALVTLDPEALDALCADVGVEPAELADVANNEKVQTYLMEQVEEGCNTKVARYQTIKKIKVLDVEFTVEGGEMTPTMKAKRNVVVEKYADEIDALYA